MREPADKTLGMLTVALWFAAGVALSRAWKGAPALGGALHKWVLWVALPALVLAKFPTMRLDSGAAVPVIAAWLCVAAGSVAVLMKSFLFGAIGAKAVDRDIVMVHLETLGLGHQGIFRR